MSQSRKLSRRQFLKLVGGTAVGTVALGASGTVYGKELEPRNLHLNRFDLTLPHLSPEFDGFRLAHVTDIHADRVWMNQGRLNAWMQYIINEDVDAVLITGDCVTHEGRNLMNSVVVGLSPLAAHTPTYAVPGNHDHWSDIGLVREGWAASGITDLSNSVVTLERDGALLHLCGVDDVWELKHRLERVLSRLPEEGAALLLAHEPDYADESATAGRFDLQLSGHSHGGQVVLPVIGPLVLPKLGQKYHQGRYQVRDMIQYTSRGIGMVEPRVRFNCRPEIPIITLRSPR